MRRVERDLVVARTGGVQAAGSAGADDLGQTRFDVGVDVFEFVIDLESALFDLGFDLIEAFEDAGRIAVVDDVLPGEHPHVGAGALDVVAEEQQVGLDRGGVGLDEFVGRLLEASAPEPLRFGIGLGHGCCRSRDQPPEGRRVSPAAPIAASICSLLRSRARIVAIAGGSAPAIITCGYQASASARRTAWV